jgi:predicted small lipoprotein YifL
MKQNYLSTLKVGLFSMLLITSLSACDKKGPAETVMDKADDLA